MNVLGAIASAVTGGAGGDAGPDVTPGSVSAWAVSFHLDTPGELADAILTVGSDTYDGSVSATLPDDLSGGTYEIVIEGITDDDYHRIRVDPGQRLAAKLHLWWKDQPGFLGDLANFSGFTDPLGAVTPRPPEHSMVAVLRVDSVRRRAGERRYEAVVTCRERVFARLGDTRVNGVCYPSLDAAVQAVAQAAGITAVGHGLSDAQPAPNDPNFASTSPGTGVAAMKALGGQAVEALKAYGEPIAIVRDGKLHVGKYSIPVGATRTLDEDGGLVQVERGADRPRDAAAGDAPESAPTARGTVTLTSLGRPDIKPFDKLSVTLPSEDFPVTSPASLGGALLTALTGVVLGGDDPGTPAKCIVGSVSHKLSRRQGFVTTVHAVVLASDSDDGWDQPQQQGTPAPAPPAADRGRGSVAADNAKAAADAVHKVFADVSGRVQARIAQIRRHPASTGPAATTPRHTSDVWYADIAGDGKPAGAQRVEISQDRHGELREVPYLSPFAWGTFGLVLPRYPGTRVLLANAGGGPQDLVDLGAIWERGGGPPAEAGDYWLVLPTGLQQKEDIGEGDGKIDPGMASHDLIDADGTRVIETGTFVIRVTDQLTMSNSRPTPGSDAPTGAVLIETKSANGAAQIILKDDGTVTIKGTSITFDTGGQGDITLKANNVKVSVSGTMDVS